MTELEKIQMKNFEHEMPIPERVVNILRQRMEQQENISDFLKKEFGIIVEEVDNGGK